GTVHIALRRRVVRRAIERVRGSVVDVEFAAVERIVAAIADSPRDERFQIMLPGGDIYVTVDSGETVVARRAPETSRVRFERPIAVPGATVVPELGIVVEATRLSRTHEIVGGNRVAHLDADQ